MLLGDIDQSETTHDVRRVLVWKALQTNRDVQAKLLTLHDTLLYAHQQWPAWELRVQVEHVRVLLAQAALVRYSLLDFQETHR